MKKSLSMVVIAASLAITAPAVAAETINVVFTQPDGGVTTGLYSGTVRVRASGTGFSWGSNVNDAFYLRPQQVNDSSYYQLTFSTTALVGLNPAQNAKNFIVGGVPAYQASGIYNFLLNTGAASPTTLHFGVGDGQFGDNGGSYTISVAAIPEPATWAMMIFGFGVVGTAMRRSRRPALRTA